MTKIKSSFLQVQLLPFNIIYTQIDMLSIPFLCLEPEKILQSERLPLTEKLILTCKVGSVLP